jgi:hypothetical protein
VNLPSPLLSLTYPPTCRLDIKDYLNFLYKILLRLPEANYTRFEEAPIMLTCLRLAFMRRVEFSSERVAAFTKRIWTVAPLVDHEVGFPC